MQFPISTEVKASTLIEETLDRAVAPFQMDFIFQGDQIFALTSTSRYFTELLRETGENLNVFGDPSIVMYELMRSETDYHPGKLLVPVPARPSPSVVKTVFETFAEAADRCQISVNCTAQTPFSNERTRMNDFFRQVTDAVSDDTSVYESLTFSSTSNLDGSKQVRTIFFMQTADVVVGLVEPRDRVERSFGNPDNIVYDVLVFE